MAIGQAALCMIWLGLGELSIVGLIVYAAFGTPFLPTMAGAMGFLANSILKRLPAWSACRSDVGL